LLGRFARSNSHWKEVYEQVCLAIFDEAHDYISPTWYQNAQAVPTWNYVSIHIKGKVNLLNIDKTHRALNLLMNKYEPALLHDRGIIAQKYQNKLSKGVVSFSMEITNIEAKAKLGQHRTEADQLGVVKGLNESNSPNSKALLSIMNELRLGLDID